MRLLVIHQNFPGQFGHLVATWARRPGWDVRAIGRDTAPGMPMLADRFMRYRLHRQPRGEQQHPYLRTMESAVLHGQAVARLFLQLKAHRWEPDVILAHPGWGETLYAKDIFPDARLVHFCEWYYEAEGADLGFDPEFPLALDDRLRIRTWNALHTLNLTNCDAAVTPTQWQHSRHPADFRPKIQVCHEGIDTTRLGPDPQATAQTPGGATLRAGDPVITYVARNLEPYRGFHVFMRALQIIQERHPHCHALIVGGDGVSYGKRPADAKTWREKMLREVTLDPQRTHFLGKLPYAQYLNVLRVSAAHVYLTYPFVLSWSLLEAMACGAPIVGSDTAPVRELIRDGVNGRLVPFSDAEAIAAGAIEMLESRSAARAMGQQARQDAGAYSLAAGLNGYDRLIGVRPMETEPVRLELIPQLTPTELGLLQMLAAGRSNEEIAQLRSRSPATVRNQLSVLYQKLGVARRAEAVAKAAMIKHLGGAS